MVYVIERFRNEFRRLIPIYVVVVGGGVLLVSVAAVLIGMMGWTLP